MGKVNLFRVKDQATHVLIEEMLCAKRFFQRLFGLLGKKMLSESQALLIYRCGSIHTFGMRFNIDAIFINKDKEIIKIVENIRPWRQASAKKSCFVLEMTEGLAEKLGLQIGDRLDWEE